MKIAYKRILLKLSGEALSGERKNGIDADISLGEITDLLVLWNSDAAALSAVEDNSDNGSKRKNNQHANSKNYL